MLKLFSWIKRGIRKIASKIARLIPINLLTRRAQVRRMIAIEEEQIEVVKKELPKKRKKGDLDLIIKSGNESATDLDQPASTY